MSKILENLKAYLKTPEGNASIAEYVNELNSEKQLEQRWISKFKSFSLEQRIEIINKICAKYRSDEYRDREYDRCGCEPREELFWLLYHYAEENGTSVFEKYVSRNPGAFYFTSAVYEIQEGFIVERLDGQGSVIHVYTLKEYEDFIENFKLSRYKNEEEAEMVMSNQWSLTVAAEDRAAWSGYKT